MTEQYLILNYTGLSERLGSFFDELNRSSALQEIFLKDPASLLNSVVYPEREPLGQSQINKANRFLFSLLSNQKFMKWSEEFQKEIEAQVEEYSKTMDPDEALKLYVAKLDRTKLYQEIADAAVKYSDRELLASLMFIDRTPSIVPLMEIVFEVIVVIIAIFIAYVASPVKNKLGVMSRMDLQKVSTFMVDKLVAKAVQVRQSGILTTDEGITKGSVL